MAIFLLKAHNFVQWYNFNGEKSGCSENHNSPKKHNIYNFTNINKTLRGKSTSSILTTHALRSDMKRNKPNFFARLFPSRACVDGDNREESRQAHARRCAPFFKPWGSEESARNFLLSFFSLIVLRARKGETL